MYFLLYVILIYFASVILLHDSMLGKIIKALLFTMLIVSLIRTDYLMLYREVNFEFANTPVIWICHVVPLLGVVEFFTR